MKCQNCGINFDDEDFQCPMCGWRAGKKGRLSTLKKYTDLQHTTHNPKDCTHQTFTKTTHTPTPKSNPAQGNKKNRGAAIIVVIAGILISLVGSLSPLLMDWIDDMDTSHNMVTATPEPLPATDEYTPQQDAAQDGYVSYPMLEGSWSTVSKNGENMMITIDDKDNYTLQLGNYEEKGVIWIWYNSPEDEFYRNHFLPESYDSYTICLEAAEIVTPNETFAERQSDVETETETDIWMLLYQDKKSLGYTLDPYGQDTYGFFGEDPVPLLKRQNT